MRESNIPDTVELIFNKEGQIQALLAVYTVVQFAAGGFGFEHFYTYPCGSGAKMPLVLGISVLSGVWAFNIGHLRMILKCVSQLEIMLCEIRNNTSFDSPSKVVIFRIISAENKDSIPTTDDVRHNYSEIRNWSKVTHLFIDSCASVALLTRVDIPQLQALFCSNLPIVPECFT